MRRRLVTVSIQSGRGPGTPPSYTRSVPDSDPQSASADTQRFRNQVVLVTGSSSGIGAATARAFGRAGATVVVNSRSSVDAGERVAAELTGASYEQADIAQESEAQALVEHCVERHGRLDVLVNNAGTTQFIPHGDLDAATPDIWRHILDVNVIGTWQVTVAAVPHLRAGGNGQIINVSSIAGQRPTGSSIPYACSKAALSHMTRLLANVLGPDVRVNGVAPGLTDTPWTEQWEGVREYVSAQAPLQRPATPEDVAEVIMGLARADYVTGEVVLVDGGLSLR
jgi:ketoreductase RED2